VALCHGFFARFKAIGYVATYCNFNLIIRRYNKMFFGEIIGIIAVLAAIWIIYDVIVNNKRLSDGMKILWIVCAVLFSIVAAIVYYFIGRNAKSDLFAKK